MYKLVVTEENGCKLKWLKITIGMLPWTFPKGLPPPSQILEYTVSGLEYREKLRR